MESQAGVGTRDPGAAARSGLAHLGLGSLGYRLNLVARSARANFERRLGEAGASFATWTVLEILATRGPMIQGDLAAALCIRGPTATRLLDRMLAEGLVERRPIPGDRRKTEIAPTPAGERLHHRLTEVEIGANEELAAGLSDDELRTLRHLLDRLLSNVSARN